jgi:GNAT superfamily N-acetyltransferase
MTEIRPINKSEAEQFLRLLCDVFTLDFRRAHDVFFSEPLFDLGRKWALFEGREMISVLTTTPLTFGWGNAIGIAGVATRREARRRGHASRLIREVLRRSETAGEGPALLFAREPQVYEKNGFERLDRVIRAPLPVAPVWEPDLPMTTRAIQDIYDAWAQRDPSRLRRDRRRWKYWSWHFRICSVFRDGYLCTEPGTLREAIFSPNPCLLSLEPGTEWFGTTAMADQLGLGFAESVLELYLMGHRFPTVPQMFMTDQF